MSELQSSDSLKQNLIDSDILARAKHLSSNIESPSLTIVPSLEHTDKPDSGTDLINCEDEDRRSPNWLRRNIGKIAIGALAIGGTFGLASQPFDKTWNEVKTAAPWTAGGFIASEIAWEVGAVMVLGAAGIKVAKPSALLSHPVRYAGNIHKQWDVVKTEINDSPLYRAGLAINTAGALGASGVLIAGASQLPAEFWPGALGLIALDLGSTYALRAPLIRSIKNTSRNKQASRVSSETLESKEKSKKVNVRHARIEDMSRLADIDLSLFDKAYGTEKPTHEEVVATFTERFNNAPEWMFVAEMNGQVEGFVSGFKTDIPLEDFVSWEHSTADGTLKDKVNPKGKYVYVTNMTINHEAVKNGAEDMLLAQLFVNGIKDGVKYGYFVSRMPLFKTWLKINKIDPNSLSEDQLQEVANRYVNTKKKDGKRVDWLLREYEDYGFELIEGAKPNGFKDDASLNFGVICKAYVPPSEKLKKIKPLRWTMSKSLKQISKHPKVLKKVLEHL